MVYGGPATRHRPKGIGSSSGEQAEQPVPGGCGEYAQGNAHTDHHRHEPGCQVGLRGDDAGEIIGGIAASMMLTLP